MRLLLVEDDAMIGEALQRGLRNLAFAVDWVRDGQAALVTAREAHYDLLVLDLGLPKRAGLDVLRELRREGRSLPVLILTARGDVSDKVSGSARLSDGVAPATASFCHIDTREGAAPEEPASGKP